MKQVIALLLMLVSFTSYSATLSKQKINGPECTAHIMKVLGLKAEDAYQICSNHKEETKICLLQNLSLPKKELIKKCHSK